MISYSLKFHLRNALLLGNSNPQKISLCRLFHLFWYSVRLS